MSDVDVVVLDLDGGGMLIRSLESILAQTLIPSRVVVVDNGSDIRVAERLRSTALAERVTVVRHDRNRGFAGGVNAAMAWTTSPFVALINNDVVLDADWLESVRSAMTASVGAIQTAIRRDGRTLDGAGIGVSDGTIRQIAHGAPLDSPVAVAWGVSATAALYRRELIRFDERFFAYYEDVELSARLHEAGWQTMVLPVVKATHTGSATAPALGAQARFLRTRNRYLVARLHPAVIRIGALLMEDARLTLRGRSSLRGIIAGVTMNLAAGAIAATPPRRQDEPS